MQNIFLLFASLFFYAWGEPRFVLVMMASVVLNWALGLLIHRSRKKQTLCKVFLCLDIALNLGILFVFKYLNYTGSLLQSFLGLDLGLPTVALPIGISFFTFQAMSYVIDIYREKGELQTNILYVGLYISFFPQLIAGPIVRYETIAREIRNRKETWDDFFDGFARFVMGLAKKVLLSNHLAILADQAFDANPKLAPHSALFYWLGLIAYAMQIFFDFSGYSDMAIGMGRMFGFHFLENFRYPYISTSISEFWRRWHISLGTWFRDYLYIPLGGSRVSKGRMILNLLIVWAATGLWHGANVTFLLWGLMFFLLITFEKLVGFEKKTKKLLSPIKWCYTILFVLLSFVLFRSNTLEDALHYFGNLFGFRGNPLWDSFFGAYFAQNAVILSLGALLCTPLCKKIGERMKNTALLGTLRALWLFLLFVLSVASLVSSQNNPFIYFNF